MDASGWANSERDFREDGLRARLREFARGRALDGMRLRDLVTRADAAAGTPRVQLMYAHHVFPDEVDAFRRQIQVLQRQYRFIPLSEAVRRCLEGRVDGVYANFSFDDGLESQLAGARVLAELGVKACFFICPGVVGETDHAKLKAWCNGSLHQPAAKVLNWDQVEELLRLGHEVGSHTYTHTDLGRLSGDQAAEELGRAREELVRRLGPECGRHFAWPYGLFLNMTAQNAATAYRLGYESCISAIRGAHGGEAAGSARPCLRRDLVMACWPRRHVRTLLLRNARRMTQAGAAWPEGWAPTIEGAA